MKNLKKNKAQCKLCLDVLESKHVHDWVSCKCGAIFIDGGLDYIRIGGDLNNIIDMCEYTEEKTNGTK